MINEYVEKLLRELGLGNASQAEKQQAAKSLTERFSNVIIYTVLEHLNAEQKEEFIEALKSPNTVEEKVAELAASVPGLWDAISESLIVEYQALKQGMQT